jgi:hypothetical protein
MPLLPPDPPVSSVVPTTKFSFIYDPARIVPVQIFVGDWGSGKTFLAMHHPLAAEGIYIDMEGRRYETMLKYHPNIKLGKVVNMLQVKKDFADDALKTFDELNKLLSIIVTEQKYKLVVVDGISDIRPFAVDKWCAEKKPKRIRPANAGDWGEVNDMVRDVIFRIFNYARAAGKTLICTALLADEYDEKGNRMATKKPDVKDFVMARADEVIYLKCEAAQYYALRQKSPRGATLWVPITIGVG